MTTIHLQDPDNRDDRGAGYEFTGTPEQAIRYLDGPLRSDVREAAHWKVDGAIALLRARVFEEAFIAARQVGVYLSKLSVIGDDISVVTLGEDSDQWLVTGTTDAWAAEEAVRAHFAYETSEELTEYYDGDHLTVVRRDDWRWAIGGLNPSREEEDLLVHGVVEGERFSGFMVAA